MIYCIKHGDNETVIDLSMVQGIDAEWKVERIEVPPQIRTWRNRFKRPHVQSGTAYMQLEFSIALINGIVKKIKTNDKTPYELLKKAWTDYKNEEQKK